MSERKRRTERSASQKVKELKKPIKIKRSECVLCKVRIILQKIFLYFSAPTRLRCLAKIKEESHWIRNGEAASPEIFSFFFGLTKGAKAHAT